MKAGIDVGFGWTKVVTESGKQFKFPTWLAYYTPTPDSQLSTVTYGGRKYVVGRDVKYEAQRIEISTMRELVTYFPVFVRHAEELAEERFTEVVTGVPVVHRSYVPELKRVAEDAGIRCEVLPQGFGIFLDVVEGIPDEEVLIIDMGYNTLDYLIMVKHETRGWIRKKGNTIEKFGLVRAVEAFRASLPDGVSYARNFSFSRLIEVFERGSIRFEGETVDLSSVRESAVREYTEMVKTRLNEEIGEGLKDMSLFVLAGGGANLVRMDMFRENRVIIPEKPEFSQARGYLRFARGVTGL